MRTIAVFYQLVLLSALVSASACVAATDGDLTDGFETETRLKSSSQPSKLLSRKFGMSAKDANRLSEAAAHMQGHAWAPKKTQSEQTIEGVTYTVVAPACSAESREAILYNLNKIEDSCLALFEAMKTQQGNSLANAAENHFAAITSHARVVLQSLILHSGYSDGSVNRCYADNTSATAIHDFTSIALNVLERIYNPLNTPDDIETMMSRLRDELG